MNDMMYAELSRRSQRELAEPGIIVGTETECPNRKERRAQDKAFRHFLAMRAKAAREAGAV